MYRVIVRFVDLLDDGHVYNVGDLYPRAGVDVDKERIEELSSKDNKRGIVMITPVSLEEAPPVAPEGRTEPDAGVTPPVGGEAKRRARKRKEK